MSTTTEPLATTVDYFESLYAEASGDASRVPWASEQPSPSLVNWLNAVAPALIRCGARVAIVGCGLGADAREVIRRGYEVTAFDCSSTAIAWAKRLDPGYDECYVRADVFDLPSRWVHRFDLVIEINNIQSLTCGMRTDAMTALSKLVAPHGYMLVVSRGAAPDDTPAGPPPMSRDELLEATTQAGLVPQGPVCCFTDEEDVPRIRAVFHRT